MGHIYCVVKQSEWEYYQTKFLWDPLTNSKQIELIKSHKNQKAFVDSIAKEFDKQETRVHYVALYSSSRKISFRN